MELLFDDTDLSKAIED
jgi:hypothetical protein